MVFPVRFIKNTKPVVRAETDLPGGLEDSWVFQGFSVFRLHIGLEPELPFNRSSDKRIVFRLDRFQMLPLTEIFGILFPKKAQFMIYSRYVQ